MRFRRLLVVGCALLLAPGALAGAGDGFWFRTDPNGAFDRLPLPDGAGPGSTADMMPRSFTLSGQQTSLQILFDGRVVETLPMPAAQPIEYGYATPLVSSATVLAFCSDGPARVAVEALDGGSWVEIGAAERTGSGCGSYDVESAYPENRRGGAILDMEPRRFADEAGDTGPVVGRTVSSLGYRIVSSTAVRVSEFRPGPSRAHDAPEWETPEGVVATPDSSATLKAVSRSTYTDGTVRYVLVEPRTLPEGIRLSSEGQLEVAADIAAASTGVSFTVAAIDSVGFRSERTFEVSQDAQPANRIMARNFRLDGRSIDFRPMYDGDRAGAAALTANDVLSVDFGMRVRAGQLALTYSSAEAQNITIGYKLGNNWVDRDYLLSSAIGEQITPFIAADGSDVLANTFRIKAEKPLTVSELRVGNGPAHQAPIFGEDEDAVIATIGDSETRTEELAQKDDWYVQDTLDYEVASGSLPAGAYVDLPSGQLVVPSRNDVGDGALWQFSLRATDGAGFSSVRQFMIIGDTREASLVLAQNFRLNGSTVDFHPFYDGANTVAATLGASARLDVDFGEYVRASSAYLEIELPSGFPNAEIGLSYVLPNGSFSTPVLVNAQKSGPVTIDIGKEVVAKTFRLTSNAEVKLAEVRVGAGPANFPPAFAARAGSFLGILKPSEQTIPIATATQHYAQGPAVVEILSGSMPTGAVIKDGAITLPSADAGLGPWGAKFRATDHFGYVTERFLQVAGEAPVPSNYLPVLVEALGGTFGKLLPVPALVDFVEEGGASTGVYLTADHPTAIIDFGEYLTFTEGVVSASTGGTQGRNPSVILDVQSRSNGAWHAIGSLEINSANQTTQIFPFGSPYVADAIRIVANFDEDTDFVAVSRATFGNDQAHFPTVDMAEPFIGFLNKDFKPIAIAHSNIWNFTNVANALTIKTPAASLPAGVALLADGTLTWDGTKATGLEYPFDVTVENVLGMKTVATLKLGGEVVDAKTVRPLRVVAPRTFDRNAAAIDIPDRIVLHDDYRQTSLKLMPGETVRIEYEGLVKAKSYHIDALYPSLRVAVVAADGSSTTIVNQMHNMPYYYESRWYKGAFKTDGSKEAVGQTFTITNVGSKPSYIGDFRLGESPASLSPALIGRSQIIMQDDGTILSQTSFDDRSPWSEKVRYEIASASQELNAQTDGDKVTGDPGLAITAAMRVKAVSEDGNYAYADLTVLPVGGALPADAVLPISMTTTGVIVRAASSIDIPDNLILHDDTFATSVTLAPGKVIDLKYDEPVSFTRYAISGRRPNLDVQVELVDGSMRSVSSFNLDYYNADYTSIQPTSETAITKHVRIINKSSTVTSAIYSMRPGNGPASLPPVYPGTGRAFAEASGLVIPVEDVLDKSPYSTGLTLVVEEAPSAARATSAAEGISIDPLVEATARLKFRATASDGNYQVFEAYAHPFPDNLQFGSDALPNTATLSPGARFTRVSGRGDLPDRLVLHDGDNGNFVTLDAGASVEFDYAASIIVDAATISSTATDIDFEFKDASGAWVNLTGFTNCASRAGCQTQPYLDYTKTVGEVVGRSFRIRNRSTTLNNIVQDFRVDASPAALAPTYLGKKGVIVPANGTLVTTSNFKKNSPHSKSIALGVQIPPVDGGASSNGTTVTVPANLTSSRSLTVRATNVEDTNYGDTELFATPTIENRNASVLLPDAMSTTGIMTAPTGMANRIVLHDGQSNSSVKLAAGQSLDVTYDSAVTLSSYYLWSTAGDLDIQIEAGEGRYASIDRLVTSAREQTRTVSGIFASSKIRIVNTGTSDVVIYDFRPGAGAASLRPSYTGGLSLFSKSDGFVLPMSAFQNKSVYASSKLAFTIVSSPAGSNPRIGLTDAGVEALFVNPDASFDGQIVIRAASDDGNVWEQTIRVRPFIIEASLTIPSNISISGTGRFVRDDASYGIPDHLVLHDGSANTKIDQITAGSVIRIDYAQPVRLTSYVYTFAYASAELWYEDHATGELKLITNISRISSANGGATPTVTEIVADHFEIRVTAVNANNLAAFTEMRFGNGAVTKMPRYAGKAARTPADDGTLLVAETDFIDDSPYSDVVTLSVYSDPEGIVTADEVDTTRVLTTLTDWYYLKVRATSADGTFRNAMMLVGPLGAQIPDAALVAPSRVVYGAMPLIGNTEGSGIPDHLGLHDGSDTTYIRIANNSEIHFYYTNPVKVSRVHIRGKMYTANIYADAGDDQLVPLFASSISTSNSGFSTANWTITNPELGGEAVSRHFVVKFLANSSYPEIGDIRLGNGVATQTPILTGLDMIGIASDGTILNHTAFDDRSPYSDRVTLTVTAAEEKIAAATNGDTITGDTGLKEWANLTVLATSQDGTYVSQGISVGPTGSGPIAASLVVPSSVKTTGAFVRPSNGRADGIPDHLLLHDADAAFNSGISLSANDTVDIYYSRPVSFSNASAAFAALKLDGTGMGTTGAVYIEKSDGSLEQVKNSSNSNASIASTSVSTTTYNKTLTTRRIRLTMLPTFVGTGVLNSFRAGNGLVVQPPALTGSGAVAPNNDGVSMVYTDFNDASPYSERVTLSVLNQDSGINAWTNGDMIGTDPLASDWKWMVVRATSEDGSFVDQPVIVGGSTKVAANGATTIPSRLETTGTIVRDATHYGIPDNLLLHTLASPSPRIDIVDGKTIDLFYDTPIYFTSFGATTAGITNAKNLEFWVDTFGGMRRLYDTNGAEPAYTSTFAKTWAKRIRIVAKRDPAVNAPVSGSVSRFMPGSGTAYVAMPTLTGSDFRTADIAGKVLDYTTFNDLSGYSDRVTLSILSQDAGVNATTDGDTLRVTTPMVMGNVKVRATSQDKTYADKDILVLPYGSSIPMANLHRPIYTTNGNASGTRVGMPDDLFLMDNSTATGFTLAANQSVVLTYDRAVQVSSVFMSRTTNASPLRLEYRSGGGEWKLYTDNFAQNITTGNSQAMTSIILTQLRLTSLNGPNTITEFRPNNMNPSLLPTTAIATSVTVSNGMTLATYTQFNDASPWSSRVTLSIVSSDVPASTNGDTVTISTAPSAEIASGIVTRATSEDGTFLDTAFNLKPTAVAEATLVPTYAFTGGATVAKSGSAAGIADGYALYDGQTASTVTVRPGAYIELTYSKAVSMSSITLAKTSTAALTLEYLDGAGRWQSQSTTLGSGSTSATTALTARTATKFRISAVSGDVTVTELRPGNFTSGSAPSYSGATSVLAKAGETILAHTSVTNASPYSSRITLSILSQTGTVGATTDGNNVIAGANPEGSVTIRATGSDGLFVDLPITVRDGAVVRASCREIYDFGVRGNGDYQIDPDGAGPLGVTTVYCDMSGGGWTAVDGLVSGAHGYPGENKTTVVNRVPASLQAFYRAVAALSDQQKIDASGSSEKFYDNYQVRDAAGATISSTNHGLLAGNGVKSWSGAYWTINKDPNKALWDTSYSADNSTNGGAGPVISGRVWFK